MCIRDRNKDVADIIHGLNVSVASKVGALAARLGPVSYTHLDQANIRNITQIAGGDPEKKIYKMLEFAGDGWKELKAGKRNMDKVPDVADPWYTGNFDDTWRDVTAGCEGLLKFLD